MSFFFAVSLNFYYLDISELSDRLICRTSDTVKMKKKYVNPLRTSIFILAETYIHAFGHHSLTIYYQ